LEVLGFDDNGYAGFLPASGMLYQSANDNYGPSNWASNRKLIEEVSSTAWDRLDYQSADSQAIKQGKKNKAKAEFFSSMI
jgi:hypothetical protein